MTAALRSQAPLERASGIASTRKTPSQDAPSLHGIAPIVPVKSVQLSLGFYVDRLGFRVLRKNPDNTAALVARGAVRLMLIRVPDRKALAATREHLSAYVWAADVDALYAELAPALAGLPDWRVRPPFTQPYGVREFHVKDPDGFLLFFAEDTLQDALAGDDPAVPSATTH
ncbi:MAG: VOC family protein [Pseudomonadota bacterium]